MGLLHKELPDDQLHNPKGFEDAANDTILTKNSSGSLAWVEKKSVAAATLSFISGTISGTPTEIEETDLIGKSKAVLILDNIFKGIYSIPSTLNTIDGKIEGLSGLEDGQIYLIIAV
jgi:hypothetical protein